MPVVGCVMFTPLVFEIVSISNRQELNTKLLTIDISLRLHPCENFRRHIDDWLRGEYRILVINDHQPHLSMIQTNRNPVVIMVATISTSPIEVLIIER